jgi:hypothetical protein
MGNARRPFCASRSGKDIEVGRDWPARRAKSKPADGRLAGQIQHCSTPCRQTSSVAHARSAKAHDALAGTSRRREEPARFRHRAVVWIPRLRAQSRPRRRPPPQHAAWRDHRPLAGGALRNAAKQKRGSPRPTERRSARSGGGEGSGFAAEFSSSRRRASAAVRNHMERLE